MPHINRLFGENNHWTWIPRIPLRCT